MCGTGDKKPAGGVASLFPLGYNNVGAVGMDMKKGPAHPLRPMGRYCGALAQLFLFYFKGFAPKMQ